MRTVSKLAWVLGCSVNLAAPACGGGSSENLFSQPGQAGAGAVSGTAGAGGSSAQGGSTGTGGTSGKGGYGGAGATGGQGATAGSAGVGGSSGNGGIAGAGGAAGAGGSAGVGGDGGVPPDMEDCATAASNRSHVGCEFWPTVTGNLVWSIFDFAVIVVNPGTKPADIQVTGPNSFTKSATIFPGAHEIIALPWIASLKGPDTDTCGAATSMKATVKESNGAYHLTSTRAVGVYQFSPLEAKGVGGPPGKNWSSCPGNQMCGLTGIGCFSFSSDASMLFPTTSLTATYRIAGASGWASSGTPVMPSYVVITATQNNTQVGLTLRGRTLAGGGLAAMPAGSSSSVVMQQGDVLELVGGDTEADDFSGSLISASAPVQVITGMPCRDIPSDSPACDHLEEIVPPAETLGMTYLVTVPAAPNGTKAPWQQVKLVGNVDATTLTFDPPITASGVVNGQATLGAGQALDLGQQGLDFKVSGNHEFVVLTFMAGSTIVDPNNVPPNQNGDPSQSYVVPIEQFRDRYALAVPADYDLTYLNIVAPSSAVVTLDGNVVPATSFVPIGSSGMVVARLAIPGGASHVLSATAPIGAQIYGYDAYTSYQMPAGAGARWIAPIPTK